MATPKSLGYEVRKNYSVSVSPSMAEYIEKNHLSPSKIFQKRIAEIMGGLGKAEDDSLDSNKNTLQEEIFTLLKKLRAFHDVSLKPANYKENQIRLKNMVDGFLEKYPMVTRAEVFDFIERGNNFYDKIDAEKLALESEAPLDLLKGSTSVYMDASKNKIKEINGGNQ